LKPGLSRILVALALAIVHTIMLRGTAAATSFAALVVAALVGAIVPGVWLLKRMNARGLVVAAVATIGVVGVGAWTALNLETIALKMNRDVTLDGRRPIWHDVRGFIRHQPIRGYGYWAFWDRPDLTAASYAHLNNAYGSAHNSMLEVMLGLGVVGLIFYLAIVLYAIAGVSMLAWKRPSLAAWWWCVVLAFLVVENMTESFVLVHSYISVLLIAAAFVPFAPQDTAREAERPDDKLNNGASDTNSAGEPIDGTVAPQSPGPDAFAR
jgi:O-antigen ligase